MLLKATMISFQMLFSVISYAVFVLLTYLLVSRDVVVAILELTSSQKLFIFLQTVVFNNS